jgi:hypothetical protein
VVKVPPCKVMAPVPSTPALPMLRPPELRMVPPL